MRTPFASLLLLCAACSAHDADPRAAATPAPAATTTGAVPTGTPATSAATASATTSSAATSAPAASGPARAVAEAPIVRGLYVNRFAAQSRRKMAHLLAVADSTEINALVIDVKDEFGLNYHSADAALRPSEGETQKVGNLQALVDSLKAHHVIPIARIVVFKDSVTARVHPEWTIRKEDGSLWRDKKGITWVNPYHRELWDYNIRIAEEMARMGFEEVQFDYIRFPEPYPSLPKQVFPGQDIPKPDALAAFLKEAQRRLHALGARSTADIFGLVTSGGTLEVGQNWDRISPNVDVVLPMTYPSHYPPGNYGLAHPNGEPYAVLLHAAGEARARDAKLGIANPVNHVRPWLQAFTLGAPHYGPEQIEAQKRGVYDAGYESWTLWSPGSKYDEFLPALEKGETVARGKRVAEAK